MELVDIDDAFDYYDEWRSDIDDDGITEISRWERKPLEAVFRYGPDGPLFRVILVHAKSKGIFDVVDLHGYARLALANRKRLAAQAARLRMRIDTLLDSEPYMPFLVMGDMNDGPGFDAYEASIGKSFVETVMGSVFAPDRILLNALVWPCREKPEGVWTARFPDPIVSNAFGREHSAWIDHILASPDLSEQDSSLALVAGSGSVLESSTETRNASDHLPVRVAVRVADL